MDDREPPGYDDWFDEPEPPTLESGRGGRASYDIPAETEEDVWVLPEDEPRKSRRPGARGDIAFGGRTLTSTQVAILAVAGLALFIAFLAAIGVFSSSPAVTTPTTHPITTLPHTHTTPTTPTIALPTQTPIQLNDKGPQVKLLQQALIKLQFLHDKADGTFGPATQTAVEDFQSANGLTVDGVVGKETLATLRQALTG
jgi:hypothetical protein